MDKNAAIFDSLALSILDSLPFALYYCDSNLIVRYINKTYASYLGIDTHQALGKKITEILPETRAAIVMEKNKQELYDEISVRPGFAHKRILANRIPIRDAQKNVIGFVSQLFSVGDSGWENIWNKLEAVQSQLGNMNNILNAQEKVKESLSRTIIGTSPKIRDVIDKALFFGETDEAVLITGDTGTGKELFADLIHRSSRRSEEAFVCINCANFSKEFIISELFGYASGAFTGARHGGKIGLFEKADQGTIFLDEIGDLPLEAQGVLLRVLETKMVQRLNSTTTKKIDFRLVSATNRDLKKMILNGTFREDLYYRISSLHIALPALSERREDIPLLIKHILDVTYSSKVRISSGALDILCQYSWPGNVRQLRNTIISAAVQSRFSVIKTQHLPEEITSFSSSLDCLHAKLGKSTSVVFSLANEREHIEATIQTSGGNLSEAARRLGVSRTTLYKKVKKYNLFKRS